VVDAAGAAVCVPPEDPDALADVIRQLRTQPRRLSEMGRRGRTFVQANYSRAEQAGALARLLQDAF
jgi:glycosyltransferase involved in cell wall biosynthesis